MVREPQLGSPERDLAGSDGDVRGADLTIQLGARLGRDARALVDEGGGAIGRQLAAAQRHGGVLEPLDQALKRSGGIRVAEC